MKSKKLSEAQVRFLRSTRDHGDPGYGVSGMSASGGMCKTWTWGLRNKLFEKDAGKEDWYKLTEKGAKALEAGRIEV